MALSLTTWSWQHNVGHVRGEEFWCG